MSFINRIDTLVPAEKLDAFRRWMGEELPVLEGTTGEFPRRGGFVLRAWHGTTHDFTRFDPSKLRPNGFFGSVAYFTTSEEDAWRNYTDESPDLHSHIEMMAENYVHDQDNGDDVTMEEAVEMMRARFLGATPRVLEFFIRTTRPCLVLDDVVLELDGRTFNEEELYDEVRSDFADRLDADPEGEEEDALWAEIDEAMEARREAVSTRLHDIVRTAFAEADACPWGGEELMDRVVAILMEAKSVRDFVHRMRHDESACEIADADGVNVSGHVMGRVLRGLGYDSIVMPHADAIFPGMKLDRGTAHVHVFPEMLSAAKVTDSQGFDPETTEFTL